MVMARKETLVQLNEELLAVLDQHAAATGRSRSALIREALERYLDESLEAELDRRYIEGYRKQPPGELDYLADINTRRSIAEEPW
jgi:metal-responsive CopG/Arc/MetJ family transcriptional regulator